VFTGAGVKTVVLFFTKGKPTKKIWYYQLDKHFTKTNALTEADLEDFLKLQATKADSANSCTIDVDSIGEDYDLSVKNPNIVEEKDERTPKEIYESLLQLQDEASDLMEELECVLWPDEDSMDYIVQNCLTAEEKREYDELQRQADELEKMMGKASPDEENHLRQEFREAYGKIEDLINKYKKRGRD
jgi:type I restriction enzyme M protein